MLPSTGAIPLAAPRRPAVLNSTSLWPSLHGDAEFRGEEFGEEHELGVVDGRSAQRVHAGDLVRFQSPDVDVAEGGAFALEDADTAARKRDPADLRPVEVDLVDLAVAELDIGELRPAQVEVGDTAIGESHLLPHAVIDNAGTDPCSGDLGVQQVSTGHVPGVGTAVRDLGTGDPGSGEVDRCVGIAEVDVRPSAVEERRLGGVCLGEVEVDELHAFEEVL